MRQEFLPSQQGCTRQPREQSLLPQPPENLQALPLAHDSALRAALLNWAKLRPVLLQDAAATVLDSSSVLSKPAGAKESFN